MYLPYPMTTVKTKVVDKVSYDRGFTKSLRKLKLVEDETSLQNLITIINKN